MQEFAGLYPTGDLDDETIQVKNLKKNQKLIFE
jgi:hypothetical protein